MSLTRVDGQLRAGYMRAGEAVLPAEAADGRIVREEAEGPPQFAREATQAVLPITQCPIAAPILWRAAEAFLGLAGRIHWLPYLPDQLELFTNGDESRVQFTLFLRGSAKGVPMSLTTIFTALCEQLRAELPQLTGAGIALLPPQSKDRSRRTEQARPGPAWGAPGLNYAIQTGEDGNGETAYWVPRGAFFQVNRFLLPALVSLATANRSGSLAWDLYAGVGLFARPLARSFAEVVAVEIAEPAATALAATKLANLHAVKATTLDFLRAAVIQRERPELIVFDPPRTGAGPEVCALLARVAAPTVVFVSCSPQTLPGDLLTLAASGYAVAELHLVDLFPQTTHLEAVAVLRRWAQPSA